MGLATLTIPVSSSRSIMPRLFLPFIRHQVLLDLFRHLAILLSTLPIRVSSTARPASSSAWSYTALPMARTASSTFSWGYSANSSCAFRAAAISSFKYSCVSISNTTPLYHNFLVSAIKIGLCQGKGFSLPVTVFIWMHHTRTREQLLEKACSKRSSIILAGVSFLHRA